MVHKHYFSVDIKNESIFESISSTGEYLDKNLNNCMSEEVIKMSKYFIPVLVICCWLEKIPDIWLLSSYLIKHFLFLQMSSCNMYIISILKYYVFLRHPTFVCSLGYLFAFLSSLYCKGDKGKKIYVWLNFSIYSILPLYCCSKCSAVAEKLPLSARKIA